ncbi:DNA repair protein XRCC2 [Trifolium pratense]|uniref:DNA repair protein XRCC2 n=1 Tax=Trifolium pratense TaxID=57577 RepID=A0A2K3N624_TRIPR|nr:DNA repair protein XRCC2 [Trifolium pratense]
MNEKGREQPQNWIKGDESGADMLKRVWRVRPFLLPPPLHRVPLRVGNVLELVGPSPSAKTQILIQTAITCILPKNWNGIHYGGFDHLVLFIDLDSRFDINRFSQLLIYRIIEPYGESSRDYDKELYDLCMARFFFQFLQTLKVTEEVSENLFLCYWTIWICLD